MPDIHVSKNVPDSNFWNPTRTGCGRIDSCQRIRPELEPDSVMAASLFCMLMTCVKLCKLYIICSVLMSLIRFMLLWHIVMHNIVWMLVSAYKWVAADQILWRSRTNAVSPTGLLRVLCHVSKYNIRLWYLQGSHAPGKSWIFFGYNFQVL